MRVPHRPRARASWSKLHTFLVEFDVETFHSEHPGRHVVRRLAQKPRSTAGTSLVVRAVWRSEGQKGLKNHMIYLLHPQPPLPSPHFSFPSAAHSLRVSPCHVFASSSVPGPTLHHPPLCHHVEPPGWTGSRKISSNQRRQSSTQTPQSPTLNNPIC